MHRWICFALVVVASAGCGDDSEDVPTGTFSVSWTLADAAAVPTCATYQLADVVVTATETATGVATEVSATCSAGTVVTAKLPLGAYTLSLEAMGTFADVAGMTQISGTLVVADQTVPLASAAITVLPPTSKAHAMWTLRKTGAAMTCAQITQQGVRVTNTPSGGAPVSDIWDCTEPSALTDIPYGPFTAKAEVLGTGDQPFGSSAVQNVAAKRGTVPVMLTIEIP
jgi:hypothetical protein